MSFKAILTYSVLFAAQLAAGHSVITNAVGDAGGSGMALGVDPSTPRDGTRRQPFQQDATRFRGDTADTVGETVGAGPNEVEAGTASIMEETGDALPQITPGGEVKMTLHQVNSDGAGPYTCMINADGTAQSWQQLTVTTNVDGSARGRNNAGSATDHPLTAAIPADQQCTGTVAGQDNTCLVKCMNPARAGPFGGVVPVQMAAGNATGNAGNAGNSTAPAGTQGNTQDNSQSNAGNAQGNTQGTDVQNGAQGAAQNGAQGNNQNNGDNAQDNTQGNANQNGAQGNTQGNANQNGAQDNNQNNAGNAQDNAQGNGVQNGAQGNSNDNARRDLLKAVMFTA